MSRRSRWQIISYIASRNSGRILIVGSLGRGELGHWARGGLNHRRFGKLLGASGAQSLEPAGLAEYLALEAADHLVVGGVGGRQVLADPLHMLRHRRKSRMKLLAKAGDFFGCLVQLLL